jgi:hypothetical protein
MKFNILKRKPKVDKEQEFIEKEFENGNIVIPTDSRDYVDLEEFKRKTNHIPHIQDKLNALRY